MKPFRLAIAAALACSLAGTGETTAFLLIALAGSFFVDLANAFLVKASSRFLGFNANELVGTAP